MNYYEQGYYSAMKVAFIDAPENDISNALDVGALAGGATGIALGVPLNKAVDHFTEQETRWQAPQGEALGDYVNKVRALPGVNVGDVQHYPGDYAAMSQWSADKHNKGRQILRTPHGNPASTKFAPSLVLHEMGHLHNSPKTPIRALQQAGFGGRMVGGIAGGLVALPFAMAEDEDIAQWAPAAAAVPMVPTLIEEARASTNANRLLSKLHDAGQSLGHSRGRMAKALLPAYGTYLAAAAAPAVGAYATKRYLDEHRNTPMDKLRELFG